MGLFTKDIQTFEDLFLHQLQDIYYAEKQIAKALPKMAEKSGNPQLAQAFEGHLGESQGQIDRLEKVFAQLGETPKGVTCPAIDGIIKEANEVSGEIADKAVLDAALVAAGQAVEHYEITRYGTLISWAKQLGRTDAVSLLEATLAEEKAADVRLTKLAESRINKAAEAV
ncbi:ferritin-like domain-containing protein [Sphingomonas sp.]|uniref:YciE/YciF ferroxidase family protein n=1 Tax=Sphingomonas sp. TaxID=28214 RepID=UPI003AFFABA3